MTQTYVSIDGSYLPIGNIGTPHLPPGTFHYLIDGPSNTVDGMEFTCPCGCGVINVLPFIAAFDIQSLYEWDGNYEHPTIKPAMAILDENGRPHWRGRITDGEFIGGNKDDG